MDAQTKADKATGVDFARNSIRTAILRGEFGPSGKLTLTDLAERIGTSVTPIREALRDLAGEGLVDIDPHRGARVHNPPVTELRETYALRLMLEGRAMRELALLSEEERAVACIKATRLAKKMESEQDVPAWAELNRAFHAEIALPLGTAWPRLYALIETLRNISLLPVAAALKLDASLMRQADIEHQDLIRAIYEGDADAAEAITLKHLGRTRKTLLEQGVNIPQK